MRQLSTLYQPGILHRPLGRAGLALSILLAGSMFGGLLWFAYAVEGVRAASLVLVATGFILPGAVLQLWARRVWMKVDATPPAPMERTEQAIIVLALIVGGLTTAEMVQGDLNDWAGVAIAVAAIALIFVPRLKRQRPREAAVVNYTAWTLAIAGLAGLVVQMYLGT